MPTSTTSTSSVLAISRRSGDGPANRADAIVERTISERMPDNAIAIASARLVQRNSFSGSGRSMRNGSTASRITRSTAMPRLGVWLPSPSTARSSDANAPESRWRSPRDFASARSITRPSAMCAGEPPSADGRSFITAYIASIGELPANTGRPVSASWSTAPSENRSAR